MPALTRLRGCSTGCMVIFSHIPSFYNEIMDLVGIRTFIDGIISPRLKGALASQLTARYLKWRKNQLHTRRIIGKNLMAEHKVLTSQMHELSFDLSMSLIWRVVPANGPSRVPWGILSVENIPTWNKFPICKCLIVIYGGSSTIFVGDGGKNACAFVGKCCV